VHHSMPMALKRFGVIPAIGKSLSAEERDTISNWLVDNFDEKWDEKAMNMVCSSGKDKDMGKGMMKCGAGKCGGGMTAPKPKAGGAMKCAAGKCGGK